MFALGSLGSSLYRVLRPSLTANSKRILTRSIASGPLDFNTSSLHKNFSPSQALKYADDHGATYVDLKFTDMFGTWHHLTVPRTQLSEDSFSHGFGFDGSSIRAWQSIENSDMVMVPDPRSAVMDPFTKNPTLSLICDIKNPDLTGYDKDPRYISSKAHTFLRSTGIADHFRVGPEAEFFVFNDVRYFVSSNSLSATVDSIEGHWNSGEEEDGGNLGYKPLHKGGYFPVPPVDKLADLRGEMCNEMMNIGIPIEAHHHEVAAGGQCEINMRFNEFRLMGDQMQWYKYVVRNVANRNGASATFMPKPLFGDNGSGMHVHVSLHGEDGKNLFAGEEYAGLSEMALYFVGGIIKHADALLAFTNPTINSYKRLVPGYEAPVFQVYSGRNRSAFIRIPVSHPKGRRAEFRTPDPSANPYLAFSAILMAGLDGIKNNYHPGAPHDRNLYAVSKEEARKIPRVPASLDHALEALERNHHFLTAGDVFTEKLISDYIETKFDDEINRMRLHPHPMEYQLYYAQ